MNECTKYYSRQLRRTVSFERETRTADGAGGSTSTWAVVTNAPTRAHLEPKKGREVYGSDRQEARSRMLCVVRYTTTITDSDRVVIDGEYWNIDDMRNVDRAGRWWEIDLLGGVAT